MPEVSRTTWTVAERERTDIPLAAIWVNGVLELYADVLEKNYFNFSFKGNKLSIIAGDHVGLIPLNDRVALLVEPKTGWDNWIHIVGKARGNLHALDFIAKYSRLDTTSQSLLEFLGNAFLRQIESIEKEGLYRQYSPQEEITESPRGRILFEKSVQNVWARGYRNSGSFRYYRFSADNPHNRLVKYALYLTTKLLTTIPRTSSKTRSQMADYENLFLTVPFDTTLGYVDRVLKSIKDKTIPEIRGYYNEICYTAILIIELAGLIPKEHATTKTLSFTVNMADVFEDYCYYVLNDQVALFGDRTVIQKDPVGRIPLFSGGESKAPAQPDILVSYQSGARLPIEVKYKDNPARSDLEQVITYGLAYRASIVVLLCISSESYPPGWEHIGITGEQIDVWVYRIDTESTDIEAEEKRLAEEISGKLQPQADSNL